MEIKLVFKRIDLVVREFYKFTGKISSSLRILLGLLKMKMMMMMMMMMMTMTMMMMMMKMMMMMMRFVVRLNPALAYSRCSYH